MDSEKIRDLIRNNAGYFSVFLVSMIYIATAFVDIDHNEKTVGQIIADGVVTFFLGILINRIFDMQGMMNGDRDVRVLNTVKLHGETVTRIAPFLDRLEDWCEEQNRQARVTVRKKFLMRQGIRYDDFFDEDGFPKPYVFVECKDKRAKKMERRRWMIYQRAVYMKLTPLNAGMLISDGGRQDDPYYFGRTKAEYEKTTFKKDVVSKVVFAMVCGYYGVTLAQDFSYARLIWTALQVGIFLIMGVVKMYQSYIFVTDEYRGRIVKKVDTLQRFEIFINKEDVEHGNKGTNGAA